LARANRGKSFLWSGDDVDSCLVEIEYELGRNIVVLCILLMVSYHLSAMMR
jgi:hypothetical protein